MGYKRLVPKSDQELSIQALCRQIHMESDAEVVPEAAPPIEGHETSVEHNTLILNIYRTPLVFSSTHHNRSQGFCFVFDMVWRCLVRAWRDATSDFASSLTWFGDVWSVHGEMRCRILLRL